MKQQGKPSKEITPVSLPSGPGFSYPELSLMPYTGKDVGVAVIDSGSQKHADLAFNFRASVSTFSVSDAYGHGNHVAGIIGGKGSSGHYSGIAPDSNLISLKALNDWGGGKSSDVIAALDWIIVNKDRLNIRVANLSLGHPVYQPAADDPLVQAVEAVWNSGVTVVVSAGNSGKSGYGSITSPGNSSRVITVGSVTHWGDTNPTNDVISSYSSKGPTVADSFVKPDLVAPGNRVISAKAASSYLEKFYPDRLITAPGASSADYLQMSGTSMSAGVVSGAVALMLEKDPSLTPDTIKARLMRSADKPAVADVFSTGAGMLNIAAALDETGSVLNATSPRSYLDEATGMIGFDKTSDLWGGEEWALAYLWSDAYLGTGLQPFRHTTYAV